MTTVEDSEYISCSCNRTPHSLDWGRNGLICYGACNSVAIYDPTYGGGGKIVRTLVRHKGRVNSVQWLKLSNCSPETELLSASSDGTIVIWSSNSGYDYSPSSVLKKHGAAVTYASGLYVDRSLSSSESGPLLVLTASADSSIIIWKRLHLGDETIPLQTISLGTGFCLCASLTFLPGCNEILIAISTDDSKIHLFANDGNDSGETLNATENILTSNYKKVCSLIGHDDWVRGLDFATDASGDLLLVSCGQDTFVRLWRISPRDGESFIQKQISELSLEEDIQPKENLFVASGSHFSWSLESVLAGHEGWVYSVNWCHLKTDGQDCVLKFLSASLDKTMVVWSHDSQSGLWSEEVRVGEMGGNTLGFYGGKFKPDGCSIIGHGYQGALHMWNRVEGKDKEWEAGVVVRGHFSEVVDLQWEPGGMYLISTGTDQTTRIHAPWVKDDCKITWYEIARPQVHGHDMSCLAVLSRFCFASGSEEKIIRSFKAPRNFLNNFKQICKIKNFYVSNEDSPEGASVPTLGLSNKAVYEGQQIISEERHIKDEYPESSYFVPLDMREPPTEENLLQNTLWPEVQKLYGHGYELYCLAARADGKVLASACKATTPEHASIILWSTETWQQIQKLYSHQLTVTQMAFSPDGTHLLSASRDRQWSLFKIDDSGSYNLSTTLDKKSGVHTRIIWCCSWTHDSCYFATGSRDGKVAVWNKSGEKSSQPLELKTESVTAVAFSTHPSSVSSSYILAVGLDSGAIIIYRWNPSSWEVCQKLDFGSAHHSTVRRLSFRPLLEDSLPPRLQLASCGSDHTVKIHNLRAY